MATQQSVRYPALVDSGAPLMSYTTGERLPSTLMAVPVM